MLSRSPNPHTEAGRIWSERLVAAVRDLREAEAEVARARAALDGLISSAHEDGLSIAHIARVTGLDRKTVSAALE
jgi:hypothetical protein